MDEYNEKDLFVSPEADEDTIDPVPEAPAAEVPVTETVAEEPAAPEAPAQEAPEAPAQEEPVLKPRTDYYADGTPVMDHSVRPDQAPQGQGNYRQYQFGNDWRDRQVAPQPMGGQDPKKKGRGGIVAAIAIVCVIGILVGAIFAGLRAATGLVDGTTSEFAEPDTELVPPSSSDSYAEAAEPKEAAPTLIPAAPSEGTESESSSASSTPAVTQSTDTMSVADVAEMSMPAMVSITTMTVQQVYNFYGGVQNYEAEGAGSGIIVGQTDTEILIATNDHVISGAKELSVCFFDEQVVEGAVKGTDTQNDLAIVAVSLEDVPTETMEKIRVISIGDSDEVRIGEQVVAIGNALGFGQSVSAGVISAKNRTVTLEDGDHVLMQTDAAINPGNSGGALLNMKGELIGINEVKYVSEDTEGIGYAIPITFAKPILDELMERTTRNKVKEGERGYLGISCITVTSDYSQMYRIPTGVYVDSVEEGGAAANAGIQARDIIVKLGDYDISTQEELLEEMKYHAAGETVKVTVSRLGEGNDYKEMEFDVTLGERPADLDESDNDTDGNNAQNNSGDEDDGFGSFFQIPGGNNR